MSFVFRNLICKLELKGIASYGKLKRQFPVWREFWNIWAEIVAVPVMFISKSCAEYCHISNPLQEEIQGFGPQLKNYWRGSLLLPNIGNVRCRWQSPCESFRRSLPTWGSRTIAAPRFGPASGILMLAMLSSAPEVISLYEIWGNVSLMYRRQLFDNHGKCI